MEEGWLDGGVAERVIEKYLLPLAKKKIDTLILGCTHYPILAEAIREFFGAGVALIDSAVPAVRRLRALLEGRDLVNPNPLPGRFQVFVSDLPRTFQSVGERFLGEKLPAIKVVQIRSQVGKMVTVTKKGKKGDSPQKRGQSRQK